MANPFFGGGLFTRDSKGNGRAQVLDIQNALVHWHGTTAWQTIDQPGLRSFVCELGDPLADMILVQVGAYPDPTEIDIDYNEIIAQATTCIQHRIDPSVPLPLELLEHPSLGFLTRYGLSRHYSVRAGWDYQGFFVGDVAKLDDLAVFWNLRAADINLSFFDPAHASRFAILRPDQERRLLADLAHLDDHRRRIAVWSCLQPIENATTHFAELPVTACQIDPQYSWNGGGVRPPMMIFGEASSLGVFDGESEKPRVSFALSDKPFSGDRWFYSQHLVVSVDLSSGNDRHTFHPPYVPEWNRFFSKNMHLYHRIRIEPERIGIIVDAVDHDASLRGLQTSALVEQIFESAGHRARLSSGGLIARQVIARLGGLTGARAFKIPGVRRLLKTYGPRDAFTKKAALQLIGGTDPQNPEAKFSDHKELYIEARPAATHLTPEMVFEYLVEKGLFRIGAELICPACNLASWIALDELKQRNVCELCGNSFDAARQLVRGVFRYRRTGVFGLEKHTQGAIPVTLTLQQLDENLGNFWSDVVYATSYDLAPIAGTNPPIEIDLIMVRPRTWPEQAEIILGECKDEGGVINATDIANLRRIADALPSNRFETFILLAKLRPFTPEEIVLARSLNGPYHQRVILLTARELEPDHVYERARQELGIQSYGGSPAELARVTSQVYFQDAAPTGTSPEQAALSSPPVPRETHPRSQ